MQTRRTLLKHAAAAPLGLTGLTLLHPRQVLAQLSAEEQAQAPTLVTIYLRGGSDPINTIIPYGDRLYYEYRPTIAIAPPGTRGVDEADQVRSINNYFGFHPAAAELHDLYTRELLAPIVCVGSTHPTRSHFDAQDFMERAAPGVKTITDGWLNRYLRMTRAESVDGDPLLRAISLQPTLPRSLRGEYPVLAVPTAGAEQAMNVFEQMYECDGMAEARNADTPASPAVATAESETERAIMEAGDAGIEKLRYLNQVLRQGPAPRNGANYPNGGLGNQLRNVAKVIKSNVGLEVAALDYGGWDHHAYQGSTDGTFSRMMGTLSQAINAFVTDLDARMAKTVVLVMSEFGRTARENGTNGTDHGHGGYMFAVSGAVKPSPARSGVYGEWRGLEMANLYQSRDLPTHTDFRDVFSEVLRKVFRFNPDAHDFFPGYDSNERAIDLLASLHPDVDEGRPARRQRRR